MSQVTAVDELCGTPRHLDGSVQARYSHIIAEIRWRLLEGLTDLCNAALDQRMNYSVGSPVRVLDALLRQRRSLGELKFSQRPPETPKYQAWLPREGL